MAKTKRIFTLLLRLLALAATLAAAIIMATSNQTTTIYGISFEAKYSFTPAFKFFVIANAIVSIYGFLVLFLPSESLLWRLVVAVDVIITMLLTSSISAALAIAYVGKKGNSHAGWLPICGQVSQYCDRVTGALIAGFIGTIIYLLLLLHSIHTVLDPLLVNK
ncbi:CASP-like protein 1C1 [Telopea speciosissima]|uniref:CASP-like protein 1C1 n=1 Tax=Telopea speciosissima TaxID=54955 RepID=UPI001CC712DE|nr:CASP-like protein 1C1 [Telopea speciosissima]